MITSPYNFVPLHDTVVRPDWGEPSHERPFSDAVSGTLTIELVAKTPIYVRGTHPKPANAATLMATAAPLQDREFASWVDFYRPGETERYAIPAASIRGAIRSIVKIAGYGAMDDADDEFISVRDLRDLKYTKRITVQRSDGSFEATSRGGWLRWNREKDRLQITPCKIARVEQADDVKSGENGLEEHGRLPENALGTSQAAEEKYRLWGNAGLSLTIRFDTTGPARHLHSGRHLYYARATNLGGASARHTGMIVFTGQPSDRMGRRAHGQRKPGVKHMEFIFFGDAPVPFDVSEEVEKRFRDVHADSDGPWKQHWEAKLALGGAAPVFWLQLPDGTGVADFGLAQMFRLPSRSVRDGIPPAHLRGGGLDIAERIFGTLRNSPLRGRAVFGPLASEQPALEIQSPAHVTTVLGAPRPSFYPAYLEQTNYNAQWKVPANPKPDYNTWLATEVRIRGWKRYPAPADAAPGSHALRHVHPLPRRGNDEPNYDVATAFRPLRSGATFTGTIRFHNLRRVELGALLWALTWGGNSNLRHSVGMGKSLGMGSCQVNLSKAILQWMGDPAAEDEKPLTAESCRDEFIEEMNKAVPGWAQSAPMRELLAMANPRNSVPLATHLNFPELDDFRTIKQDGFALPRTTELVERKPVQSRQTKSGNPPMLPPKLEESQPEAPPVQPAVLPSPPVLKIGQKVVGILEPEPITPTKPTPTRLYFSPDEHPELAGNTGRKIGDSDAKAGDRWNASVSSNKPWSYVLETKIHQ